MAAWKPTLQEIEAAAQRVSPYLTKTPLYPWHNLKKTLGFQAPVFLKLENLQRTGSFKVRGAANKILHLCEQGKHPQHIIAASAGNHAQGVAFISGRLKHPATIVMPEGSPLVKVKASEDYGARVILHGSIYDEAYQKAQELLKATPGSVYVHAYEDEDVICGQGTMGLEIHEQLKAAGVDDQRVQVVIPIGGGGLFCGVASALKALRPESDFYGVVSDAATGMADSVRENKMIPHKGRTGRTLAEGLAVKSVSPLTYPIIRDLVKEIAVVNDVDICVAISTLMERAKQVTEGAGSAGIAAALARKLPLDPSLPTVFVICGGNIDMSLLSNVLERGFSRDARWLTLVVEVEDRPGQLAMLAAKIGELKANILEVQHDRISLRCAPGRTQIRFQLETRGPEHADEIRRALAEHTIHTEVVAQ